MNDSIENVGPTHTLHNSTQIACDILSIDIEAIGIKLFSYFSIYIVWT